MAIQTRFYRLGWALSLACAAGIMAVPPQIASAQSIVVMVNDEPVTSYDIAQRQRFLALSTNLSSRMKQRLQSEETKAAFQAYMRENQPKSREEAQALQKKFIQRTQQSVIANASSSMRKQAIEELINERLMLQAAREQRIQISEDEVNQFMARMAQSGSNNRTLEQFLATFRAQGIDPETVRERIRAQSAWRQVIRRVYGSRVRAAAPSNLPTLDSSGTVLDVEIVRLEAQGGQAVVAERLIQADELRRNFKSCGSIEGQVRNMQGASLKSVKQANIKDFPGDVQVALQKAKVGDITPPSIRGDHIELHAVCAKDVTTASTDASDGDDSADDTQRQFQLYSERHLKDLRTRAHLKYPKSG